MRRRYLSLVCAITIIFLVAFAFQPVLWAQISIGGGTGIIGGSSAGQSGSSGCSTAGTAMLKGNGMGGCANAVPHVDYAAPTAIDPSTAKSITFSQSPYSVAGTDSLLFAAAGPRAPTVLLLPSATGSKRMVGVTRQADGNAYHVTVRPSGTDTINGANADFNVDIAYETFWFLDFATGVWIEL